jgi:glycyl-tRNA synthetase
MLSSNIGAAGGNTAYLRPETAQGIFINFKNLLVSTRSNLPFGVAQQGNSYRNEISPRQWLIRLREFAQMEIEYFFNPDKISVSNEDLLQIEIPILTRDEQAKKNPKIEEMTAKNSVNKKIIPNDLMAYFIAKEFLWYQSLGIPKEALRFRHMKPEETPHYSKGNFDMEIKFDFGWKETVGNAYRTDHDLANHMKNSGEDFSVVEDGKKIVPHVVEPSFGIQRTMYAVFLYCYREGKDRGWEWFDFPAKIAPFAAGIFPLVNKGGLEEKAEEIHEILRKCFDVFYDDSGSIGKRYARSDEIGTPFGITIDFQTLEDHSVTLRDRNTTKQIRVKIKDLTNVLWKLINQETEFENISK